MSLRRMAQFARTLSATSAPSALSFRSPTISSSSLRPHFSSIPFQPSRFFSTGKRDNNATPDIAQAITELNKTYTAYFGKVDPLGSSDNVRSVLTELEYYFAKKTNIVELNLRPENVHVLKHIVFSMNESIAFLKEAKLLNENSLKMILHLGLYEFSLNLGTETNLYTLRLYLNEFNCSLRGIHALLTKHKISPSTTFQLLLDIHSAIVDGMYELQNHHRPYKPMADFVITSYRLLKNLESMKLLNEKNVAAIQRLGASFVIFLTYLPDEKTTRNTLAAVLKMNENQQSLMRHFFSKYLFNPTVYKDVTATNILAWQVKELLAVPKDELLSFFCQVRRIHDMSLSFIMYSTPEEQTKMVRNALSVIVFAHRKELDAVDYKELEKQLCAAFHSESIHHPRVDLLLQKMIDNNRKAAIQELEMEEEPYTPDFVETKPKGPK